MIRRIAAGLLGGLHAFNGLFMLIDGQRWFRITPGAASTGPFNAHFVADVGVAFIAAGLGLLALSWRTRYWPAAVAGAAFLIFHALIHIVDFSRHPHDLMSPVWIALLAAAALWVAMPAKQNA
jgi:hypothetical protein